MMLSWWACYTARNHYDLYVCYLYLKCIHIPIKAVNLMKLCKKMITKFVEVNVHCFLLCNLLKLTEIVTLFYVFCWILYIFLPVTLYELFYLGVTIKVKL